MDVEFKKIEHNFEKEFLNSLLLKQFQSNPKKLKVEILSQDYLTLHLTNFGGH